MTPLRGSRPATRQVHTVALVACALVSTLTGCAGGSGAVTKLQVSGSTTVQPIAEIAGEMYTAKHPLVRVLVSGIGSSAGIEAVASGQVEIGTSSRDLKPGEDPSGLVAIPIAHDAIAVIVNPDNPVKALTRKQVAAIFEGRIRNWSQIGGPDSPIGLVNRDEASGTREAFGKIVLEKRPFDRAAAVLPGTGQVRFVVAQSPSAIGYISVGFVDKSVKALAVDGVAPTEANIVAKRYPISRLLYFLTKGTPSAQAQAFIDYVLSSDIQERVVRDAGFLPVQEVAR